VRESKSHIVKGFYVTSRILTQIYEIQTPFEAQTMVELGVDHIGSVIVSAAEWKQPVIKETVRFVQQTPAQSSLILLYHDQSLVFSSLDYYQPDIVHFCEMLVDSKTQQPIADEVRICLDLQTAIRERFPEIKIMRSIPIPEAGRVGGFSVMSLANLFESISDFFLTDTLLVDEIGGQDQPVCGFVGITGKTCDWQNAAHLVNQSRVPVFLAGGLSPDNVYDGIARVRPAGVDSCTLTNSTDESGAPIRFKKNMGKVKRFVDETRRAEQYQ
jgi:phosphoribosylanthranilate isomerase